MSLSHDRAKARAKENKVLEPKAQEPKYHNKLNISDMRIAVQQVAEDDATIVELIVVLCRDNKRDFPLGAWDILMILWDGHVRGKEVARFWACCGRQGSDFVESLKRLRGENIVKADSMNHSSKVLGP